MALTVVPKVAAVVDDTDIEKTLSDFVDHFEALFTPSIGSGLNVNIAGATGIAHIKGHQVQESTASTAVSVPASVTQSIWLALTRDVNSKVNGVQYTVAVAQPADSIKICDFVSGASTVTTVTDKRGGAIGKHRGVPANAILIWAGTIANIPTGFVICDGNNGTPNLLDKFLKEVPTAATDPGGTGGTSSHSHSLTSNCGGVTLGGACATYTTTNTVSHLPPFFQVAFIMNTGL